MFQTIDAQTITIQNGKIIVPDHPIIPFLEGDGVGPEVMRSAQQVVDAAVAKAYNGNRSIEWKEVLAGQKAEKQIGSTLPEETLNTFKTCHVGLKGPLNTPVGEGARSLNVAMRRELDLYANFRPVKYYAPAPSPLIHPERVNAVLFRENTEDAYAGIEFAAGSEGAKGLLDYFKIQSPENYARIRFPETSALGLKPISIDGSQRIVRSAIKYALQNNRKSVTILHKGNIMKFTEGGFMKWGYDVAEKEFAAVTYSMRLNKRLAAEQGEEAAKNALKEAKESGKLIIKDMIVDAAFERSIAHPEDMDVLVTTNLNGDYLSDALAALVGGLGIAPGANINYLTGDAIFEAVHGTAPDIAGKDLANPCSLILSSVLMLRYMGWTEAADLVENALSQTIAGRNVTADFACQMENAVSCKTGQFTALLLQRI
ncbi:MAG TPA: NADP-dependent isocitrate dehydrogenase [Anaerolineaceae bacterium]|nr:NADP-dependent isocitrate dehydrogenase [Anaerolineaceae bacterium]